VKLDVGQLVGRYTVERVLGAGGTAMVYEVTHNHLATRHALKVLTLSSDTIRKRMAREGRLQASIHHENVVAVTDTLEIFGQPALLMEYIDGPSLEQALRGDNPPPLAEAERLFEGILTGVAVAHGRGMVHRDLKPANVLLDRTADGVVPKVTDFGLAKLLAQDAEVAHTRSGISMGTPAYMAPEQVRDARTVDQRADMWSLGCMLYHLVTGERAFPGDEALKIYNAVVHADYRPVRSVAPELPVRFERAIDACLRVGPDDRVADCAELLAILKEEATSAPSGVTPLCPVPTARTLEAAPPRELDSPRSSGEDTQPPAPFPPPAADSARAVAILAGVAAAVVVALGAVAAQLWWGDGSQHEVGPLAAVTAPMPEPAPEPGPFVAFGPPAPDPEPAEVVADVAPVVADVGPVVADVAPVVPIPPPVPVATEVVVANPRSIRLLSFPWGAEVTVAGTAAGRTPLKLELLAGSHTVRMTSGAQHGEFSVTVAAEGPDTWCYNIPEAQKFIGRCR